jgi:hypothetical protein
MADLKFTPQPETRWFDPRVLAKSGMRVVLSGAFGQFLDKRELQADLDQAPIAHHRDRPEMWFDFVSDTGDGFDPTYTVAWLASQRELVLPSGERLPRGQVLVLGGDEVYPFATADAYEQRLKGPFEAALPWVDEDNPDLLAVPGNHDWYDGLTSFIRLFCQGKWIGGRLTRQRRSYFAVQLPNRWWLWGIDIQLDTYIDEPQLAYFDAVDVRPGDRVVLCTATPAWIEGSDSRGFKNLAFLERKLIRPKGARLVLSLSGDKHHYQHHAGDDGTHKVTAGGGGAFLHPTHAHPESSLVIDIGGANGHPPQVFTPVCAYPDRRRSRRMAWWAVGLPRWNWLFTLVPAVVYVLLGFSSQFSLRAFEQAGPIEAAAPGFGWSDVLRGLVSNPVSVLILIAFLGGLSGFAKPSPRGPRSARARIAVKWTMAGFHLVLHVAAVTVVGLVAVRGALALFEGNGVGFTAVLLATMAVLGGFAGAAVTGLYLAICCAVFNAHGNEAFSAMRLTGYKNFLRLHLDARGDLTVYPLGVHRAHKRWRLDPDNADEASWLAPEGRAPIAQLIEPPFTLR